MAINDYLTGIDRFTSGEKQDVQTASQNLADLQTGAGSLPNKLKEALNKKLSYNKDIINQQSETMQNYFAAPSAARAKYQDVWNPFEREKLVAQDRTMALKPYDTLTGVLDQRMGDVADITEAGVQGWQGMVDAASTQLNAATTRLGTALQAYQIAGGQQSAADELALSVAQFNEANRQFQVAQDLENKKFGESTRQFDVDQANRLKIAGMSAGGGSGNVKTTPEDIQAMAQFLADSGVQQSDLTSAIASMTSSNNIGAVAAAYNKIKADEKAKVDEMNNKPKTSSSGGWLSNLFGSKQPTVINGFTVPTEQIPNGVDSFGNPVYKTVPKTDMSLDQYFYPQNVGIR